MSLIDPLAVESAASSPAKPAGVQAPGAQFHEELERARRVAGGQPAAQDLDWLSKGFRAFLASGGVLSLERCLRLPKKSGGLPRAFRDYWLRQAWSAMEGDLSPWRRSKALAAAIQSFRLRQWPRWRDLPEAPASARAVDIALHQAFRSCEILPLTAMQLHNIMHHRRHR
jgi:hypothetical protein